MSDKVPPRAIHAFLDAYTGRELRIHGRSPILDAQSVEDGIFAAVQEAHTARLAALDAEIDMADRFAMAAAYGPGRAEVERLEARLDGLRRAREIITGKDKP